MKKTGAARRFQSPKPSRLKPELKAPIVEILEVYGKSPKIPQDDEVMTAYVPSFEPDPKTNIYVPSDSLTPVAPGKLEKGMREARMEITRLMKEFSSFMSQYDEVKEMEFTASFSAEGKFLGFGVGGAVSVKVTVGPKQ